MFKFSFISFFLFFTLISFGQSLGIISNLGNELQESSGLIYLDGKIITHNDSGGESRLYEIDTISGNIARSVYIENATNVDWEDICFDENFIYIGDFGNNSGTRTNLVIYRISIDDYLYTSNDSVASEAIYFSYSEQFSFTPSTYTTNFDAEALISFGDSLYIFTKNWGNNWTNIYPISKNPGSYSLVKTDSLDVQGLITGATFNDLDSSVTLCGYTFTNAFIFNIEDFIPSSLSNSSTTRNTLNIPIGSSIQIEGIFALDEHTVYLSSEQHISGVSSLYRFQLNTTNLCEQRIEKIIVYPNPATDYIELFNKKNSKKTIIDSQGKINFVTCENFINLQNLKRGKYYIQVECFESAPPLQTSFVIQ